MSILLSAYYPEGIVFAADKNVTFGHGSQQFVKSTATKVLSWPHKKAVIGFVGLGTLADLGMDDWMNKFIGCNRDFDDIDSLAHKLRDQIQDDFQIDFPSDADLPISPLIIHLGAFTEKEKVQVPVMYHIWNHGDLGPTGEYPPGERTFKIQEDIEKNFKDWPNPEDYPARVRNRLQAMVDHGRYLWFQNGVNKGAFSIFRGHIWDALHESQELGVVPPAVGLDARIAFCRMSVEALGSYFTHHRLPNERIVGGGVDSEDIPWPNT